jgi:opacity protein-like surface antigen
MNWKKWSSASAVGLLFVCSVYSQDLSYRQEATAQAAGSFVKTTTDDGVQQTATHTGNILGTYRYYFTRHSGVELNYGWTRGTQNYQFGTNSIGIASNVHEVSAAYVYRIPFQQWSLFVLGGGGALVFDPRNNVNVPGAAWQAKGAFNYGGGADFDITRRVFLRAEYRGLIYSSPTYDVGSLRGMDRLTHRAAPSIGIGYRF